MLQLCLALLVRNHEELVVRVGIRRRDYTFVVLVRKSASSHENLPAAAPLVHHGITPGLGRNGVDAVHTRVPRKFDIRQSVILQHLKRRFTVDYYLGETVLEGIVVGLPYGLEIDHIRREAG